MKAGNIPDDVRRFILTSIPSVPFLEAVLLLQREAALNWSPSQLARRLYLAEPRAAELLQALEAASIAVRGEGAESMYRYLPPEELAFMLKRVAGYYSSDLLAVTDLIHSRLNRQAFQFADAFRWRKDT